MAWVNPTTWVADATVTHSQFNDWNASVASVGDHGGWSTWKPKLTIPTYTTGVCSSSGYEVQSGRKLQVGDVCYASFDILFSTKVTFSVGLTNPRFRMILPTPANSTGWPLGHAYLYEPTNDNTWLFSARAETSTEASFQLTTAGNSNNLSCWSFRNGSTHCRPAALNETSLYEHTRVAGVFSYRTA